MIALLAAVQKTIIMEPPTTWMDITLAGLKLGVGICTLLAPFIGLWIWWKKRQKRLRCPESHND